MGEAIIGFILWALVGCFFVGNGVSCFFAKRVTGFWANVPLPEVSDIKRYNYAMGKLWIVFGIIFILLGLPLLDVQNPAFLVISVLGIFIEIIAIMVIYTQVIEKKYRKE